MPHKKDLIGKDCHLPAPTKGKELEGKLQLSLEI
jgi:hypothetical protein